MLSANRKSPAKIPSWLIPAIGYAISIACLIWLIQTVDLDTMIQDIRSLHWGWVALAIISDISVYIYQAWRWNLLLSPVVRPPLWRSIQAIYVGLFSNEILPLRPGEIIRSYLQARWSEIPFSVAFSSAIVERTLDGIWLILVFFLTTRFVALPPVIVDLAKVLGVIVLVFSIILALVMFHKHKAHAALPKTKFGAKLRVLVDDMHLMGTSRSFYFAALASLPYLAMQVVPIYALMRAYDLDLSVGPAVVVLLIWRMSQVIPQAPGNVGTSQLALTLALGLFGVDKTTAAGLSVVMWTVITAPLLLGGFIALAVTGMNLADLKRHAHAHMKAAPPHIVMTESQPSKP